MIFWTRLKNEIHALWIAFRLRQLLHRAARTIPKAAGDTEDFIEILRIWEKQLMIAASDRPGYWKESAQKELEREFAARYRSLMTRFAAQSKPREEDPEAP